MGRRALLIGLNYSNTSFKLDGCINDVHVINTLIRKYSFTDIVIMTDDQTAGNDTFPTKQNIITQLNKLISSAQVGDILYFHYSGHGTATMDKSGDELDGKDECLYPADSVKDRSKLLLDDEIYSILQKLPSGVTLFAVVDACHSGTAFDLTYNIMQGRSNQEYNLKRSQNRPELPGKIIMLSGCADTQTSLDATFRGKAAGALTSAYVDTIESASSGISYLDLLTSVRSHISGRYSKLHVQTPQMSFSNMINIGEQLCFIQSSHDSQNLSRTQPESQPEIPSKTVASSMNEPKKSPWKHSFLR